jgi:hypothetical protein
VVKRHSVRAHTRNGRPVRSHIKGHGGGGGKPGPGDKKGVSITAVISGTTITAVAVSIVGITIKLNSSSKSRPSTKSVSAEAQAGFKHAQTTLTASGFKSSLEPRFETDCAEHSYGRVQKFFRSHPCKSLARAYIQIGEPDQGLILVAISWLAMPNSSSAEAYKNLVDTPGAGNITELSREVKLYKNIKYTDSSHISGLHGTAVWSVQVKPVFPTTTDVVNKVLADSRQ